MKIVKLETENVKRIKVAEITPEGNLVVIGGPNGAGKSSLLDSIMYALAGKASLPERPLRDGEESGRVVCDLGDYVVRRTFTAAGGGQLIVANKDGARLMSPQKILDDLTGRLTFDPLAFARMEPKQQLETLRALVGVDVSELERKRKQIYDERALVNKGVARKRVEVEEMPYHEDAPEEEVSVSALVDELQRARELADADVGAREAVEGAEQEIADIATYIEKTNDGLLALKQQLEAAYDKREQAVGQLASLQQKAAIAAAAVPDIGAIRQRIEDAEGHNTRVRENQARAAKQADLEMLQSEGQGLTKTLKQLDEEKAKAIAAARFPVEGLSFDESRVTFRGVPFDQASSAEQLRVSVAMGLAFNPKLRVLLIRDGSLLDEDSLRMVAEMAEQSDAQVWLERVSEGEECSVVIEDGTVRGAEVQPDEAA